MTKMHVKKDDTVVVITGKDKGKKGKIMVTSPKAGRVVVEGVNIVARHTKPKGQGQQGGILHKEAPVDASNVMLYCDKCGKGVRTKVQVLEDGKKVRICKKCGQSVGK